jgi:hypothetical protein
LFPLFDFISPFKFGSPRSSFAPPCQAGPASGSDTTRKPLAPRSLRIPPFRVPPGQKHYSIFRLQTLSTASDKAPSLLTLPLLPSTSSSDTPCPAYSSASCQFPRHFAIPTIPDPHAYSDPSPFHATSLPSVDHPLHPPSFLAEHLLKPQDPTSPSDISTRLPPPPCHPLAFTALPPCQLLERLKPTPHLRSTLPHPATRPLDPPIPQDPCPPPNPASSSRTSSSPRSRVNPRTPTFPTVSTSPIFATSIPPQAQAAPPTSKIPSRSPMDTLAPSYIGPGHRPLCPATTHVVILVCSVEHKGNSLDSTQPLYRSLRPYPRPHPRLPHPHPFPHPIPSVFHPHPFPRSTPCSCPTPLLHSRPLASASAAAQQHPPPPPLRPMSTPSFTYSTFSAIPRPSALHHPSTPHTPPLSQPPSSPHYPPPNPLSKPPPNPIYPLASTSQPHPPIPRLNQSLSPRLSASFSLLTSPLVPTWSTY